MNFFGRVYEIVKNIPRGKVLSYGDVARLAGCPRLSRQVGYALHSNPNPDEIPCHRVVFSDGSVSSGFAFGGPEVQRAMLEAEGIEFSADGKIDMKKFGWEAD